MLQRNGKCNSYTLHEKFLGRALSNTQLKTLSQHCTAAIGFREGKTIISDTVEIPSRRKRKHMNQQWRRQGGQGGKGGKGARGRLPPNVEKDGPRNSSKFDEKIGRGVRIHLRCEKIINTKYL